MKHSRTGELSASDAAIVHGLVRTLLRNGLKLDNVQLFLHMAEADTTVDTLVAWVAGEPPSTCTQRQFVLLRQCADAFTRLQLMVHQQLFGPERKLSIFFEGLPGVNGPGGPDLSLAYIIVRQRTRDYPLAFENIRAYFVGLRTVPAPRRGVRRAGAVRV